MSDLKIVFDSYISNTRATVITSKQEHYGRVTELKGRQSQLEMDIAALQQKERKVKETISRTLEELQLQQIKVNELKLKEDAQLRTRDELQQQISALLQQVQEAEEALRTQKLDLQAQLLRDHPELAKFEHYLGLRIEAIREDCVRFVFFNLFIDDVDREVYCQLNVGEDTYVVEETSSSLAEDVARTLELRLNQDKNFNKFLKTMRTALRDAEERAKQSTNEDEQVEEVKRPDQRQDTESAEPAEPFEKEAEKEETKKDSGAAEDLQNARDLNTDNVNDVEEEEAEVGDVPMEIEIQQEIITERIESPAPTNEADISSG